MLDMQVAQVRTNASIAIDTLDCKKRGILLKPKSLFGEGGKIFKDGFGPVLAQPSIWSLERDNLQVPQAGWPGSAELQWDGDHREKGQARTRCGRFLPMPRKPVGEEIPFHERQPIIRFPLDQTGPIYLAGPSPIDTTIANQIYDNDAEFELNGAAFLGDDLMKEIGEKKEPFSPEWQQEQRHMQLLASEIGNGMQMVGYGTEGYDLSMYQKV